jgi:hypothetical protein
MVWPQRLAIHPLGEDHLLALEIGGNLAEAEHGAIPIPPGESDDLAHLRARLCGVNGVGMIEHGP